MRVKIPQKGGAPEPSKGGAPEPSKGEAHVEVVEVPQDDVQRQQVQGDGQRAAGDGIFEPESRTGREVDDEVWRELEACPIPEVPLLCKFWRNTHPKWR